LLNNRQNNNNRRRNRNNNQRPQGNGQNRNGDNGNRIDNRARGNAPQLLAKYRTLARDSQMAGDRVLTEYYHQFADHYFRVVQESRARYEDNRRPRDEWDTGDGDDGAPENRSGFDDGDDDDGAEGGYADVRAPQPQVRPSSNGERSDRPNREPRFAAGEDAPAADAEPRAESSRWEVRAERQQRQAREERPTRRPRYEDASRAGTGEAEPERSAPVSDAPLTLDLAVLPPAISPLTDGEATPDAAPAPKKRGRPRKVVVEADAG